MGEVAILINNAGILSMGEFLEVPDERVRRMIEINTLAHFWVRRDYSKE